MTANGSGNNAERTGRFLGRAWLRFIRLVSVLARSLAKMGMPTSAARASAWIGTLLALALAIHFFFAVAVIVIALWILSGVLFASNGNGMTFKDDEPKLRQGLLGFGLYDRHDIRVDPYDPNDPL
jgi:Protein of unknown function (DUF3742)